VNANHAGIEVIQSAVRGNDAKLLYHIPLTMPVDYITSLNDARLDIFRALPKSQLAQQGGFFITEGDVVTERLFGSRYEPVSLLLLPEFVEKYERLSGGQTPLYVVTTELMQQTVGFPFHRGVMGCGRRQRLARYEQVLPPRDQSALVVLLPATQDPTNLGVMLRTCAAFGVAAVLLGPESADPFLRRVIRVSTGSALHLPLGYCEPDRDFAAIQNEWHLPLAATVVHMPATPLHLFVPPSRLGVVLGSEGHGLPRKWIQLCQQRLTIPMHPGVDSLNANIATGVLLYEITRPRVT
jgi:tRNA G18 (ribose-2'-O)-methylase SpoU